MFRRRLSAALTLGATLVAITACSTSNSGTASGSDKPAPPSASTVLATAKTAATNASAVHVKGTIKDSGDTSTLDLQLNKDGSASGTITDSGMTIPILSTGKVFYVQFTNGMESSGGIDPTSDQGKALLNKWVPSTSQMLASEADSIKPTIDYSTFIPQFFDSMKDSGDALKQTGSSTVDGVPTYTYTASDGTLDVSQSSPHYLMKLAETGDGGSLDFTNWNKPVAVNAPAQADIYTGPGA
jgi:hypothetical protein